MTDHDLAYVLLAFAAAILGSWVALDLQEQARSHAFRFRLQLLVAAALAFGTSIFVTHFIAMLGFTLAEELRYDLWWTSFSLLLALLGSCMAMALVQHRPSAQRTATAAWIMGGAICAMHYAGMEAIANAVRFTYDPVLVALSLLIAVGASWTAMQFGTRRRTISARAGGALFLALAISGMHFTGMAAAEFEPRIGVHNHAGGLEAADLSLSIGAGSLALLFLALLASMAARARERERLTELHGELNKAARIADMGAVATTLAHELNQPLTAAANYAFMAKHSLAENIGPEPVRAALEKTQEQIRRAGDIIKRARAMISDRGIELRPTDLRVCVDRCLEMLRLDRALSEPDIQIEFGTGERQVLADAVQLEQVLVNVLRNAWQALADTRDARLRITVSPSDAEFLTLIISDNGPGIPEDRIDNLFSALKSSQSGLGLGLGIARAIIDAHGGKVWAENNLHRGTTFYIALPSAP